MIPDLCNLKYRISVYERVYFYDADDHLLAGSARSW